MENDFDARPYPNEHAARLRDPGDFDEKTFRRTDGGSLFGGRVKVPATIAIIWAKLKSANKPADPPLCQALRFPTKNWTVAQAKKWLSDNGVKYQSLEAASEPKKMAEQITAEGLPTAPTGQAGGCATPRGNPQLWYRATTIRAEDYVDDAGRVSFTFSSEAGVMRWYGQEILLHDPDAIDLTRLNSFGALLVNHDPDQIAGPIIKAELGNDRRGHAVASFDPDEAAQRVKGKVKSGSLRGVSVGYLIHKAKRLMDETEVFTHPTLGEIRGPALIALRWEPVETSLTPVPADSHVGVGRDAARSLDGIEIEAEEAPVAPLIEEAPQMDAIRAALVAKGLVAEADEPTTMKFIESLTIPAPPPDLAKVRGDAVSEERKRLAALHDRAVAVAQWPFALKLALEGKTDPEITEALLAEVGKTRTPPALAPSLADVTSAWVGAALRNKLDS